MSDEILENQVETQIDMFITFTIDKEDFAIPICYINDIQSNLAITQVPSVPNYVKGISNIRGTIIPVIDVRTRFRKNEIEYDDRTCIVVIDYDGFTIGLVVDAVKAVLNIPQENVFPPPSYKMGYFNKYIKNIGRVGENVKLILDLERLINDDYEV